jgi:hypothetical protein
VTPFCSNFIGAATSKSTRNREFPVNIEQPFFLLSVAQWVVSRAKSTKYQKQLSGLGLTIIPLKLALHCIHLKIYKIPKQSKLFQIKLKYYTKYSKIIQKIIKLLFQLLDLLTLIEPTVRSG